MSTLNIWAAAQAADASDEVLTECALKFPWFAFQVLGARVPEAGRVAAARANPVAGATDGCKLVPMEVLVECVRRVPILGFAGPAAALLPPAIRRECEAAYRKQQAQGLRGEGG